MGEAQRCGEKELQGSEATPLSEGIQVFVFKSSPLSDWVSVGVRCQQGEFEHVHIKCVCP